jgi:ketosteroid isomerase-like protein
MKSRARWFLLFLLVLMPTIARAEAQDDKTKLSKAFFDDYAAALSSLDPRRILPYYHEPLTLITAPIISILTTRADIEQWLKSRGEQMKGRGYARNAWDQLHVKQLNYGLAVASGLAVRYKGDGLELDRLGISYILRRTGDGWKIAVLAVHDPGTVLRLE